MKKATGEPAPLGAIWVCHACGRTSRNRWDGDAGSRGWDSACFLNAVLCHADTVVRGPDGRVTRAEAFDPPAGGAKT